jgi:RNA polymerase sigma factor (sigma-70 family)
MAEPLLDLDLLSDGDLIARSTDDPELFGEVVRRHAVKVGRYVARRAVGAVNADDVLAETFITAFQQRHRFDVERAEAGPWLFGIATNTLRHAMRDEGRRWRSIARSEAALTVDLGGAFEDLVADRVDAARVQPALAEALARMRHEERSALVLLAWGDLTYAEIAEALDVPVGTVRSRIHRARKRLRAALAVHGVRDTTVRTTTGDDR